VIFRPELAAKVAAGKKTQTRRRTKGRPCRYVVGREYAVQPGRGQRAIARVLVTEVRTVSVGAICRLDAVAEGFADDEAFLAYWRGLYGEAVDTRELVYAITFRLVGGAA
jgi:hypothetical protein